MSALPPVRILQLYPGNMNIYGDTGNVRALVKRLEWSGYAPELVTHDVGDELPDGVDVVVGGGGQDSGQLVVHEDVVRIGGQLREWADDGVPMLAVCGMYQLFGRQLTLADGTVLRGAAVLDVETRATAERLIGNVVARSSLFGDLVGYENHSGQTFLGAGVDPLAEVISGIGNNVADRTEGARYHNVLGTYLHGSVLPKNPRLADGLLGAAITRRYGAYDPTRFDDSLADLAREAARRRPR